MPAVGNTSHFRVAGGNGVEGTGLGGSVSDAGQDPLLQERGSAEEDLALVGEVPEEGALGQSGTGGNLRGGGLVESPFRVQVECRFL